MDRANLQKEVASLSSEIDRIAESANFNGIKLLNGDLGKTEIDSYGKTDGLQNLSDGVIIDAPVDGAGKKDQFSLSFKGSFGAGDTITYTANFTDGAGNLVSKDITLTYDAAAVTAGADAAAKAGKFAGGTKEEQMESIAAALKEVTVDGTPGGEKLFKEYNINVASFDVTGSDGTVTKDFKINLTASAEGVSNVQLSTKAENTAVVDKSIIAKSDVTTSGADNTTPATGRGDSGFTKLVSDVAEFQPGDVLTFKANIQGKDMTVTLKVGDKQDNDNGVFKLGSDIETTTANLVAALNGVSFDDDATTGIDESQFKVSDYFTITANTKIAAAGGTENGSIQIKNKTGAGIQANTNTLGFGAGPGNDGLTIKREGVADKIVNATQGAAGTAASGGAPAAQQSTLTFTNSFMEGDAVTIRGILSDGLTFESTLTAGKDFAIGADLDTTMTNLVNALKGGSGVDGSSTVKVQVAQSDGTVKGVEAGLIFGAGGDFAVASAGGGSGQITLTSNVAGIAKKGVAGSISSASTTVAAENKVTDATVTQDVVGKGQSNALNTLTFDQSKIEQGTKITIDGKTYEFVNDDGSGNDYRTNTNNIAIKVANLNKRDENGKLATDAATGEDMAQAVINALHNGSGTPGVPANGNAYQGQFTAENGKVYNLAVDPGSNSLKIVSNDSGTDAVALKDIEISSGNQNTSVVKFNTETTGTGSAQKTTANVKVGDTITIDGKIYEFTDGEHRTKEEGNVAVALDIKNGYTAEDAAKALADAINANTTADVADGKPGGVIASVGTAENKDGSRSFVVNLASKNDDTKGGGHEYDAPVVEIPTGGKGLTLQVGETSEEFQKVNVAIDRMDADALGIGAISVGTQEGAAAAIDKIKSAINTVSSTRGDLGAIQNRLEHTINNLGVTTENMTAAESRIRDTDMAKEMMEFTKNNILVQASQAMLAQANQLPQGVLQLLQ